MHALRIRVDGYISCEITSSPVGSVAGLCKKSNTARRVEPGASSVAVVPYINCCKFGSHGHAHTKDLETVSRRRCSFSPFGARRRFRTQFGARRLDKTFRSAREQPLAIRRKDCCLNGGSLPWYAVCAPGFPVSNTPER